MKHPLKRRAIMPRSPSHFRFLAALAGTPGAKWREIAHECGLPEDRAELLLRSSATKAFLAWFRSLPYQLQMDCIAGYQSLRV